MTKLITHEIGSLAKPEWRVKLVTGQKITRKDSQDAKSWGKRLSLDYGPLVELLNKKTIPVKEVMHWASVYALKMEEKAGLDLVYDGEQYRSEMYQYPVTHSKGFEFRGTVRSFDNKYYKKAAVVTKPKLATFWHLDEYLHLKKLTGRKIKIPITGAYTIAAWSFDEHYAKKVTGLGSKSSFALSAKARRDFVLDVARNLIRPNIEVLVKNGCEYVQIDEPAATTIPSEVPLVVDSFNESVRGLKGEFSIHICFSDYSLLFPHIQKMTNCSQYALEFANRDSRKLGTKDEDRPGYQVLKLFKKYKIGRRIGLGVTDIHTDFIESPELVRDRILYAVKVLGDPELINPTPDCGLRTRTWEVAFKKMQNTVLGTRLAEAKI